MCEILMLIFGIITLIRGRFLLFRTKEVHGWPARIIGLFLVLPFPLSFLTGIVLGAVFLTMGKGVEDRDFLLVAQIGEFVIVALCFITAFGVAFVYAEPIRKKRPEEEDEVVPADYDDDFESRPQERSKSEGITDRPPRPSTPPDDRIQR